MGILNTTPRTWVAAEVVTAAEMNAEVRDTLTALQAAWTTYTPTLTNITLGNGSLTFAYHQVGKTIFVRGNFQAGSTTTYSAGSLTFSLPVAPHADYASASPSQPAGPGLARFASGSAVGVTCYISAASQFSFIVDSLSSSNTVSNLIPGTWTTAGGLSFLATYQAA